MPIRLKLVRRACLGIASIAFLTMFQPSSFAQVAGGARVSVAGDASLLRVQKSLIQPNLIDDLFPVDPVTNPVKPNPAPNPNTTPTPTPAPGTGTGNAPCGFLDCTTPGQPTTPGGSYGNYGNYGNYGSYGGYGGYGTYPGYYGTYDPRRMDRGMVAPDFQCNLFENTPMSQVLSSLNALSAVVNGPACDGKVNFQSVTADNAKIADVIKNFRQYIDNPELVTPDKAAEIGNGVDIAIQSAANLATTFANTAAFSKQCRSNMDAGKIATSLNSVVNGLMPYALMASSITGGTAAIPFIVGGAVITGTINSIAQVIDQNTVNIGDQLVRQAVVENTCQYIRLEQKYRFLIQNRKEQLKRLSQEIAVSQSMFSAQIKGLSPQVNGLLMRRNAIDQTTRQINDSVGMVSGQFQSDKMFFNPNGSPFTACNFGIALAKTADDKGSYASIMLGSLDQAMAVYGQNTGVQAATLKANASMALEQLKAFSVKATRTDDEMKACASTTKDLMKTIEDSSMVAKQLLKIAKNGVENELQMTKDYGMLRASIGTLDQKKIQADRVAQSLEAMRAFADSITRSEIDHSMDRIRQSLFSRSKVFFKAPVIKWFDYTEGLHRTSMENFTHGLESLRAKAQTISPTHSPHDAAQLLPFTLKNLPLDTQAHTDVCRELRGVWDQWRKAVTHLGAMNAFCGLLEPYVLDSRPEDKELVILCRSDKHEPKGVSHVVAMKNKLVDERKKDWALYVNHKIDELVCLDPTTGEK